MISDFLRLGSPAQWQACLLAGLRTQGRRAVVFPRSLRKLREMLLSLIFTQGNWVSKKSISWSKSGRGRIQTHLSCSQVMGLPSTTQGQPAWPLNLIRISICSFISFFFFDFINFIPQETVILVARFKWTGFSLLEPMPSLEVATGLSGGMKTRRTVYLGRMEIYLYLP